MIRITTEPPSSSSSLEALYPPLCAGLIVVLEGVEEVSGRLRPAPLCHVHLAATLVDDAHDAGVRDGALDGQSLLVQLLEGRGRAGQGAQGQRREQRGEEKRRDERRGEVRTLTTINGAPMQGEG